MPQYKVTAVIRSKLILGAVEARSARQAEEIFDNDGLRPAYEYAEDHEIVEYLVEEE